MPVQNQYRSFMRWQHCASAVHYCLLAFQKGKLRLLDTAIYERSSNSPRIFWGLGGCRH